MPLWLLPFAMLLGAVIGGAVALGLLWLFLYRLEGHGPFWLRATAMMSAAIAPAAVWMFAVVPSLG